jgi:tetratricopeptide (TPR) repeat protein
LFGHALKVTHHNWLAYDRRGNAYVVLGNYRQAIEDYDMLIVIRPGLAGAYLNRGFAYAGLGNYNQAIEDYNMGIEIKPGDSKAYYNRGLLYLKQGNNIAGCRDAQKACELGNCTLLEAANTGGLCR